MNSEEVTVGRHFVSCSVLLVFEYHKMMKGFDRFGQSLFSYVLLLSFSGVVYGNLFKKIVVVDRCPLVARFNGLFEFLF